MSRTDSPASDRPEIRRWWGEGTDLAERIDALADCYEAGPPYADPARLEVIAYDLRQVLAGEWDPRESGAPKPKGWRHAIKAVALRMMGRPC